VTKQQEFRVSPLLATSALLALLAVLGGCGGGARGASPSTTTSTRGSSSPSVSSSPSQSPKVSKVPPVPVESNPPGDIPDNLAFVRYANAAGHYAFTHPEGWARTVNGVHVVFTDKLNGVTAESTPASAAPTVASAKAQDVPRLRQSVPAFQLRRLTTVSVPGGSGVRIVFRRNSDPDPVTGKVFRDEVEEYLVYSSGRLVRMDLYGPVGADNVDAYRTMSRSLRIR
jgi:hypothetical protein